MERYSRQSVLPEIGADGQRALASSRVLVVGVGGLGCPAALYLAGAGVGRIGLMDGDRVALGNLPRQVLFGEEDVGRRKPEVAAELLKKKNSGTVIDVYPEDLRMEIAVEIFRRYDVILDATDNAASKYLINDAALVAGRPVASAGVSGFEGWVSVFGWSDGPCYRCWRPEALGSNAQSCLESGILAPVAGAAGCLQAVEVLKVLLSDRAKKKEWIPLSGRVLAMDFSVVEFHELALGVRDDCRCRGNRASIPLEGLVDSLCANTSGAERDWPSPEEGFAVLDVREESEWSSGGELRESLRWPLSRLESGESPPLAAGQDRWIVVCHRGARSVRAVEVLRRHFPQKEFMSLRGGLSHLGGGM